VTKKNETRAILVGCSILVAGLILDVPLPQQIRIVEETEARIGRPLTPVSYAGVARRTRRRTFRRTAVYVAALPTGCSNVTINGALLHQCGTIYYQPYNGQYAVVEVD
jgi:hypothetical protein